MCSLLSLLIHFSLYDDVLLHTKGKISRWRCAHHICLPYSKNYLVCCAICIYHVNIVMSQHLQHQQCQMYMISASQAPQGKGEAMAWVGREWCEMHEEMITLERKLCCRWVLPPLSPLEVFTQLAPTKHFFKNTLSHPRFKNPSLHHTGTARGIRSTGPGVNGTRCTRKS